MSPNNRLHRYQLLFRASTMAFGAGVFWVAIGLAALVFAEDATLLLVGLLMALLAVLTGYKITLSTMRIIDAEGEHVWRDLGV